MNSPPPQSQFPAPLLRRLRPAAPLLFYPAGVLYCVIYDYALTGTFLPPEDLRDWATLALTPWVIGAILFERWVRPGDTRRTLLLRAGLLALAAFAISGAAAMAMGFDYEFAFLRRIPLIATAILIAAIYPLRPLPFREPDAIPEDLPVPMERVLHASSAGNYVELHMEDGSALWRQTMRGAEAAMARKGFVRIHRSHLVRRSAICEVVAARRGPVEVVMPGDVRLPVGTTYASRLGESVAT